MTITLLLALPLAACFTTTFTRRWKRPRSHAHHHAIHLELCACTILIHIVDGGGWVKLVAKQAPPNIGVRRSVASIITVVMIIRCSDFFFNSFYDTVQYKNVVFEWNCHAPTFLSLCSTWIFHSPARWRGEFTISKCCRMRTITRQFQECQRRP